MKLIYNVDNLDISSANIDDNQREKILTEFFGLYPEAEEYNNIENELKKIVNDKKMRLLKLKDKFDFFAKTEYPELFL